jgi:hypothetical protein
VQGFYGGVVFGGEYSFFIDFGAAAVVMVVVTIASSAMASSSSAAAAAAAAASSSCSSSLSSSALRVPHGIKLGFSRCPSSRSSRRWGNPHSQQVHNVHVSGSLKVPEFQVEFTRCLSSKSQHHCYWHHRFQKLQSATQYVQGLRRDKTLDNVFLVSCSRNESTSVEDRIPGAPGFSKLFHHFHSKDI